MTDLIFRVRILADVLRISVFIMTVLKLAKIYILWRKGLEAAKPWTFNIDLCLMSRFRIHGTST
jgi:hypothetical protein